MADPTNKLVSANLRGLCVTSPALKAYWPNGASIASGNAGLAATTNAPTLSEPGAGVLSGAYLYKVTQVDDDHSGADGDAAEGNPSASATITVTSKTVRVTFADTPDSRATHRRVYRTKAGETTPYYKIADVAVATGTYDDNTADSSLTTASGILKTDNDRPPTGLRGLINHGTRGFGFIDTILYCSKPGTLDQWPPLNFLQMVPEDTNPIRCIVSAGEDILVMMERGLHLVGYDLDPVHVYDGWSKPVVPDRGCLNEHCAVNVAGMIVGMDTTGIFGYMGGRQVPGIGRKIQPLMRQRNMRMRDWFCMASDGQTLRIFFSLQGDGSSMASPALHWCLKLDLAQLAAGAGAQWWLDYFDHPIIHVASVTMGGDAADPNGPRRCFQVMDSSGYCTELDKLTSDGCVSGIDAAGDIGGVSEVSSVTRITVPDNIFDTGTYSVVGLYARFLIDGILSEPYLIGGVGSGYFDLTVVADPLPAEGDVYLIGGIQGEYQTPILQSGGASIDNRQHPQGLDIWYEPVPVARRKLYVTEDRDRRGTQATGFTFNDVAITETDGEDSDAVEIGNDPLTGGGRGCVRVPIGSQGFNAIQITLKTHGPDTPVSISKLAVVPAPVEVEG